ncbi:helix-turn-helix transcriptional regulator [Saccharothrix sp. NPDC042600]|uniref:helix-turn-helix domain-containing protein n=1 Tax=Saccharothrix TaxID=2071 RepID=UPI00340E3EB9|nr:hypothetical protein GCM10017745_43300 [Saccharothrix mutabilis subsp. capreolus]
MGVEAGTAGFGAAGFGAALRAAIGRSGLTLDEVSRRLRERGTPISVSSLSYWQNGDSRPRAASLPAVAALEEILGEPLTGLLVPRPRPTRPGPRVAHDLVMRRPETVARALAKLDATPDDLDSPHRLSQYLSYRVDATGREESMRVRRIVRADHDGTTRFLFVSRGSSMSHPPAVTHAVGCRPGRFRADVPSATCAFEFLLDQPLNAGELAYVEFGLRLPPDHAARHTQLAIVRPGREIAIHVTFAGDRLPRACHGYFQPRSGLPVQRRVQFDGPTRTYQFVALDPEPGQYGIGWTWD